MVGDETDRVDHFHPHHMQTSQPLFPSSICAAAIHIIQLLEDVQVNSDGVAGTNTRRCNLILFIRDRISDRRSIVRILCDVNHAPLLPLSLDRFPPNFPQICVQVVARDTWFHIPEKFPLRDRIYRKILFLGYPICDQPTGHGKRSATPTLFPSPSGHPTDVPFLGDIF